MVTKIKNISSHFTSDTKGGRRMGWLVSRINPGLQTFIPYWYCHTLILGQHLNVSPSISKVKIRLVWSIIKAIALLMLGVNLNIPDQHRWKPIFSKHMIC
jgi:hypothetical protein